MSIKNQLYKLQGENLFFSNLKIAVSWVNKNKKIKIYKFDSVNVIWNYPEATYRLENGKFLVKKHYGVYKINEEEI